MGYVKNVILEKEEAEEIKKAAELILDSVHDLMDSLSVLFQEKKSPSILLDIIELTLQKKVFKKRLTTPRQIKYNRNTNKKGVGL